MTAFIDTMRQMFGYNPATGETLEGGRLPGLARPAPAAQTPVAGPDPSTGGAPFSTEAADPGSPSPGGRVLARLGLPRNLLDQQDQRNPAAGIAGALGAGAAAVKPGMNGAAAFFAGLGGGMKHVEEKADAAVKAHQEAQKRTMELYKTLFDMDDKSASRERQTRVDQQNATRADRQDAETKRWHDIMAPAYSKDGAAKELSVKDKVLTDKYIREMSGYDPNDENWRYLSQAERDRRTTLFKRMYRSRFGQDPTDLETDAPASPAAPAPTDKKPPPAPKAAPGRKVAPDPAPAVADSETDDKGAESSGDRLPQQAVAPPKKAAAAPAPAAQSEVWRKARYKDGSIWLIGPNGEQKPLTPAPQEAPVLSGD